MINKTIYILFLSVIVFFYPFNVIKATQVSGDVWGDWTAADSPYEIIGDIRVPQCSTLTIEAGCRLEFQTECQLIVDTAATLKAVGNNIDSVWFTPLDTLLRWQGIKFYSSDSNSILSYCIVEDVRTFYHDGNAIYNTSMNISNCTFKGNMTAAGFGGGLYVYKSSIVMIDCVIDTNIGFFWGGGVFCDSSTLTIDRCYFHNNNPHAYTSLYGWGGGLYGRDSDISISNSTFIENWCGTQGGGLYFDRCSTTIVGNSFLSNSCELANGGAVYLSHCSAAYISYNIFVDNLAYLSNGAGLCWEDDSTKVYLSNNTIFNNHATIDGGGIKAYIDYDDTLVNNIICGNTSTQGENNISLIEGSDSSKIMYCDIEGGWPGNGNIADDPLFIDPSRDDFHLQVESPCIDTGAPFSPVDPDSTRADIGAFYYDQHVAIDEIQTPLPCFNVTSYPNPFNAKTTISYDLETQSDVSLEIYDILGRKVETLVKRTQPSGHYQAMWNAADMPSGMYFYKLTADDYIKSAKMMLLK